MKKRIISILLVITILIGSFNLTPKKASAAAATTMVVAIGVLAWEIIGVCTGMYDDTASAIGEVLAGGWDGLTNPDSPFQQRWKLGWNQICDTVTGWFESGELEIVDGQIKLTYSQYMELYGQVYTVIGTPVVDFEAGYNCTFLSLDMSQAFALSSLPLVSEYFCSDNGQSYAFIYYDDNRIIFSDYFLYFVNNTYYNNISIYSRNISSENFSITCIGDGFTTGLSIEDFYEQFRYILFMPDVSTYCFDYTWFGVDKSFKYTTDYCFVYEKNQLVTRQLISDLDLSNMKSGIITTTGDYGNFLKSVTGYNQTLIPPDNLDDLTDTIPTEYNPSLTFPENPDLSKPLPDQIIVGDVPGSADLPLSDYQADVDIDLDIPSIIVSKFPFCIPYDFIRFLGVLLADPVAPVFHIPLSTSPDNLEQWEGNQTIGDYLNADDLMFEIDEEIIIDLSVIPLVQPVSYTCFIVGFIILLLHITSKMIQH